MSDAAMNEGQGPGDEPQVPAGAQQAEQEPIEKAFERVKQQLEAEKQQRMAAEQARSEAEREQHALREQVRSGQLTAKQANLSMIDRALEATQAQQQMHMAQYAEALSAGDYTKAAQLQSEMGELAARKVQLEAGKAQLAAQPEPQMQPSYQVAPQDPFEQALQRYTPRTQAWLRQHPDVMTDPKLGNMAMAAHYKAVAEGHIPDTDAYFQALEQGLGVKATSAPPKRVNGGAAAAPPSREGVSNFTGQPSSSLRLQDMTPAMMQAAKTSDMKPEEWLRQYNELLAAGEITPFH